MTEHALIMCREPGRHSTLDKGHEDFFRKMLIQETSNLGRWWTNIPKFISELLVREKKGFTGETGKSQEYAGGAVCRTAHLAPIIILKFVGP